MPLALKKIIEKLNFKSQLFDKLEIYSYNKKRQNDGMSCSVFSLLDLKNLYERKIKTRSRFN